MSRKVQILALLSALCTGVAFAASPVAYVYVQEDSTYVSATESFTNSPISIFSAASSGELTQIKGSPFTLEPAETIVGTNGTHFITVDNTPGNPYLRSYAVALDGVIGKEVSKIDLHTWSYYGGTAELSPNGENVYAGMKFGDYALLSFSLSKSGDLAFQGTLNSYQWDGLPVVTGNDKFAYEIYATGSTDNDCGDGPNGFAAFNRESKGFLANIAFSETDPIAPPTPPPQLPPLKYYPYAVTSDPTDHLAVLVNEFNCYGYPDEGSNVNQLASYTVGSQGDLVSTNTYEDMPALPINAYVGPILLNPAGTVLAVAVGTGIQFYHFNGAAPLTEFAGPIGLSGFITAMAWDKDNHLYALNGASGRLHVYTAGTTNVVETPGSPYSGIPYCGSQGTGLTNCTQTLIVRVP